MGRKGVRERTERNERMPRMQKRAALEGSQTTQQRDPGEISSSECWPGPPRKRWPLPRTARARQPPSPQRPRWPPRAGHFHKIVAEHAELQSALLSECKMKPIIVVTRNSGGALATKAVHTGLTLAVPSNRGALSNVLLKEVTFDCAGLVQNLRVALGHRPCRPVSLFVSFIHKRTSDDSRSYCL